MKKFTKISLIVALVLTIVGIGCWGAGMALGGTASDLVNAFQQGDFTFGDGYEDDDMDDIDMDYDEAEISDGEYLNGEHSNASVHSDKEHITKTIGSESGALSFQDINKIDLEMEDGTLYLEVSDSDEIQVSSKEVDGSSATQVVQDGEELKVRNTRKDYSGSVTLFLPKDMKLDEMDILLKKGEVIAEVPFTVNELDVEIGAGSLKGSGEITADTSDWKVSAGELILDRISGNEMDFECNTGSIEANIIGSESDYGYDLECTLGEISVGKKQYSGAFQKEIKEHNGKKIEASCGAGEIKLDFIQ